MRAPVGHDAVTAVRERSRLTAVTDDRVVGRLDYVLVQNREIRRFWRKVADAVREPAIVELPQRFLRDLAFHRCDKVDRKRYQLNGKCANAARRHFAAAMGSTNEDDSLDAGVGLESRGSRNKIR